MIRCCNDRFGILLLLACLSPVALGLNPRIAPAAPFQDDQKPDDPPAEPRDDNAVADANPLPGKFKAPELDGGHGWLNTDGEITLRDLRGKVVLLDFWTYCCINCMHVLPDLKHLEQKYGKQLVVIGVHSAKFDNEKETENIRRAIMRYEIEHPVINDSDMTIWRKYHVSSWPTLVVIDPEGQYLGYISGEGNREALEAVLDKLIAYHRRKRTLDESPVKFNLERNRSQSTPLRFPGKVLADEAGGRLFISDSNHNRIVIASLDGRLLDVIGTGAIGAQGGAYDRATFDHPQGMALGGETLYVADTENHLIRAVDLDKKLVTTLAGTGTQGNERRNGGALLKTAINSPWDLTLVENDLYIAMAGPHQIWVADLKRKHLQPFAGSGREDIINGSLREAALAQPSGMATDGKFLYVVDSEGSSVRKVSLDPAGKVTTVVGTSDLPNGRCLFEFGDVDGVGSEARLQHPLGIAIDNDRLYVADSYNHKIKRVDLANRSAKTFAGNGQPGDQDDPPQFSEPAGLSVARGLLYVADTNNHRLRTIDLQSGAVSTLAIEGLAPPAPVQESLAAEGDVKNPVRVKLQRVAGGTALTFEVALNLPEGYKLNALAPVSYRLKAVGKQELVGSDQLDQRQQIDGADEGSKVVRFDIPLAAASGKGELQVTVSYGYCREGKGGLCKLGTSAWTVPIEIDGAGGDSVIRLESKGSK